jgi:hypothetical protein
MCTSYTLTPTFPPRAPFYLLNRENARLALIRGRKLGVGRMGGEGERDYRTGKKIILYIKFTMDYIKYKKSENEDCC